LCTYAYVSTGKPDLFITMTCNPQWPEITQHLLNGQTASDRPDLVARVFADKQKALCDDLFEIGVLGAHCAHVWAVEFQKRGLPHIHILYWLTAADQPRSANEYDQFVRAELPDEQTEPLLYKIISTNNIHKCGHHCMTVKDPDTGTMKCNKRFPKPFTEHTTVPEDGYPQYRRRSSEQGGNDRNQFVVPYNDLLSLRYQCHINVEICSTISAVKYLFVYVFKGADMATAEIIPQGTTDTMSVSVVQNSNNNSENKVDTNSSEVKVDEIKQFLDLRCVGTKCMYVCHNYYSTRSVPQLCMWCIYSVLSHNYIHSVFMLCIMCKQDQVRLACDYSVVTHSHSLQYGHQC
jgi:hypothetical protein